MVLIQASTMDPQCDYDPPHHYQYYMSVETDAPADSPDDPASRPHHSEPARKPSDDGGPRRDGLDGALDSDSFHSPTTVILPDAVKVRQDAAPGVRDGEEDGPDSPDKCRGTLALARGSPRGGSLRADWKAPEYSPLLPPPQTRAIVVNAVGVVGAEEPSPDPGAPARPMREGEGGAIPFLPRVPSFCLDKEGGEREREQPAGGSLRDAWRGDVGLALFSPLDEAAFEPLPPRPALDEHFKPGGVSETSSEYEHEEEDEEDLPLIVVPEPPSSLQSSPRILTEGMMRQIRDRGLPPAAQIMSWTRVYSLERDGDSFYAMLRSCEAYKHTVFAVLTASGDVLGGYADKPWAARKGFRSGQTYYGGGGSFLFATNPAEKQSGDESDGCDDDDEEEGPRVHVYGWTGENTYSQFFCVEEEHMAMGGGGSFGVRIEENFTRGTTGRCSTFHNPPLTKDSGGCFDIVRFEMYGLKSCSLSLMYNM